MRRETLTKHDHTFTWNGLELVVGHRDGRFGPLECKSAQVLCESSFLGFLDSNEHVRPLDGHLPEWVTAHYIYDVAPLWEDAERDRKAAL